MQYELATDTEFKLVARPFLQQKCGTAFADCGPRALSPVELRTRSANLTSIVATTNSNMIEVGKHSFQ